MKARNEMKFEMETKDSSLHLYAIGDLHYGSKTSATEKFEKTIAKIKNDKKAIVIGMGDYVEAIKPDDIRFDMSTFDSKAWAISEQFAYIEKQFEKIKDKLIGLLVGNHGAKFIKQTTFNEMGRMCERLNVSFLGWSTMFPLTLTFEGKKLKTWRIFASHGTGGGYEIGSATSRMHKFVRKFDADLYLMGHTHRLVDAIVVQLRTTGNNKKRKIVPRYIYLVNTGSFMQTYLGGTEIFYGERALYDPLPIGYPKIVIDKEMMTVNKVIV